MRPPEDTRRSRASAWIPEVAGVLTADQVVATGRAIAAVQQADGAIGWPDGHVDAWNHIECAMALSVCGLRDPARRAYEWLRASQRPDGSWHKKMPAGQVDLTTESNHAAYCAVGVWHELLVSRDEGFAQRMWPVVKAAVDFVLGLQTPRGEIIWRRAADGTPDSYALLAGSASMYSALRCAIALAEYLGEPQPDWELAADQLAHAVAGHPEAFADKSRYSMDWYYPVLGGPVRGAAGRAHLDASWDRYVVPGLGVRCVSDEPWVTAAETAELAIALEAIGDAQTALDLLDQMQRLRDPSGAYWTGWQYVNQRHYPDEQSSYTAAAIVLAADALCGATGGSPLFRDVGADPAVAGLAGDPGCGCEPPDAGEPRDSRGPVVPAS
ncbi:MAG TPA: prenyltransferase [Streptosporangiaceae bacterium]